MRVLKFGGSSIAAPDRVKSVGAILSDYVAQNIHFTVVFSAFGGITDSLIDAALLASRGSNDYNSALMAMRDRHIACVHELFGEHPELQEESLSHIQDNFKTLGDLLHGVFLVREASPRTMDYVLSFGERNSAYIIANYLRCLGIKADYLDAREIIVTNKKFGSASVNKTKTYKNIVDHYASHPTSIQVVTGFIAADKGGLTTTLGRGGSDYTAALLGAALDADIIEIWTDVDGVLTADPRVVSQAFSIPKISYNEAYEMSHFGAKVIYPPTIKPAHERSIPLRIKNTFNPGHPGTLVSEETTEYKKPVKGVSSIKSVCLVTLQGSGMIGVPGIAGRLFSSLAREDVNIIMITQGSSEHSISFAIAPDDLSKAQSAIKHEFDKEISANRIDLPSVEEDLAVLAIIGENMRYVPGIAAKMMWALGSSGINAIAIAQGSSELNISVVVHASDKNKGVLALHDAFFLSEYRTVPVFMVGCGLVGSTLMAQMKDQMEFLKEELKINIKLVGLANSRKMAFNAQGLSLSQWKDELEGSDLASDIGQFVDTVIDLDLNHAIFVDNTANPEIPSHYLKLLENNVSVCTPNKIAASSEYAHYLKLQHAALVNNVGFGYETNVGAGLPIISTISDLRNSGDHINKIEAVLSGSLSYIFNNFLSADNFAELVLMARDKGYTEPDPREDLFGKDFARKMLILGRESGYKLEEEDVVYNNFLPESSLKANSLDEFITALRKEQPYFDELKTKCLKSSLKPVLLGVLLNGKAEISLNLVDAASPFHSLNGSDNMISIHSKRYNDTPLVVRGPGAGAQVTAAGVFAEIISLATKNLSV